MAVAVEEQNTESPVIDTDVTEVAFEEPYEQESSEDYSSDVGDDYFDMIYEEA